MKANIQNIEVGTNDLAVLFQKSRQTVRAWEQKGMPRNKHGAYPLLWCFHWWLENVCDDGHDSTLTEERRRKIVIEREIKELELQEKKGSLVSRADSLLWVSQLCSEIKSHLLYWPHRLSPEFAAETDQKVIHERLRKEIYSLLQALHDGGKRNETKQGRRNTR